MKQALLNKLTDAKQRVDRSIESAPPDVQHDLNIASDAVGDCIIAILAATDLALSLQDNSSIEDGIYA